MIAMHGVKERALPSPTSTTTNVMPAAADTFYDDFPRLHFHDLDSQPHYLTCSTAIQAHDCGNFVVDFGGAPEDGGRAFCALNVGSDGESLDQVKALLGKRRDMTRRTRWMWVPPPSPPGDLGGGVLIRPAVMCLIRMPSRSWWMPLQRIMASRRDCVGLLLRLPRSSRAPRWRRDIACAGEIGFWGGGGRRQGMIPRRRLCGGGCRWGWRRGWRWCGWRMRAVRG